MVAFAAFTYGVSVLATSLLLYRELQLAEAPQPLADILIWQAGVYAIWLPVAWLVWRIFHRQGSSSVALVRYLWLGTIVVPAHTVLATVVDALSAVPGSADLAGLAIQRLQLDLLVYASFGVLAVAAIFHRRAEAEADAAANVRLALDAAQQALQASRRPEVAVPEPLLVSVGSQRVLVPLHEIEWMGSAANYVVINWGNREGLVRQTLQAMEAILDPGVFARIHRSTIANLTKVHSAEPLSDGSWRLTMLSGAELAVSRTYRDAILDKFRRSTLGHR